MFFFVERNPDKELEDETIVPGFYHTHLILETIQDHIFDEPNRTLKKVYYQGPNPIIERLYYNDQERHYDLITEVLKRSYWLKNAPNEAIKIKPIYNLQSLFVSPEQPNDGYLLKQISQEKLALDANLNRAYIGYIERGERHPSIATIYKISVSLKTPLYKLFIFTKGE